MRITSLLLIGFAAACGGTSYAGNETSPEAAPVSGASMVTITDDRYSPDTLRVTAGTTVQWRNEGTRTHSAKSDAGDFDSGAIDAGGAFSHTFDRPGTFTYNCASHPGMSGVVIVSQ